MFNKTILVVSLILSTHKIWPACSKTLPNNTNDAKIDRKSPATSYYRHNIFGPNTYAFGFEVNDKVSGNIQFRDERRYMNGTTQGSYGYVRPDGSVMVTRFLANTDVGYLSQSQNFAPGDEPIWQEDWPTWKPTILKENSLNSLESEDGKDHIEESNLTSILLPVEPIKEEHGIDLNPPELEKQLVNPALLEVINGEAPLISDPKNKNSSVKVETINKFIPAGFPIVPFELPGEDLKINLNEELGEKPIPVLNKTADKDTTTFEKPITRHESSEESIESKTNNTEKYTSTSTTPPPSSNDSHSIPAATSISIDKNSDWYEKFINQTRQEYLATVH